MSIASAITAAQGRVEDAYTAVANRGGTIPATKNLTNLPTAIDSIPAGGGYTEFPSYQVDSNGIALKLSKVLDGTEFANIVGMGADAFYYRYYYITTMSGPVVFYALATISGSSACGNAFYGCTGITSVDLSLLTTISGTMACYETFRGDTGLTTVDLSSLATISGSSACRSMFYGCTGITSVDLSSLTTVSGVDGGLSMFQGCTSLTTADLHSLTTISGAEGCLSMFSGCTSLVSANLSNLTSIAVISACSNMFRGTSLTTLSFPALTSTSFGSATNQFINMLASVTGCTVHFPSNLQSVIGSWSDVINGFGGTNTTVLFDLPATT